MSNRGQFDATTMMPGNSLHDANTRNSAMTPNPLNGNMTTPVTYQKDQLAPRLQLIPDYAMPAASSRDRWDNLMPEDNAKQSGTLKRGADVPDMYDMIPRAEMRNKPRTSEHDMTPDMHMQKAIHDMTQTAAMQQNQMFALGSPSKDNGLLPTFQKAALIIPPQQDNMQPTTMRGQQEPERFNVTTPPGMQTTSPAEEQATTAEAKPTMQQQPTTTGMKLLTAVQSLFRNNLRQRAMQVDPQQWDPQSAWLHGSEDLVFLTPTGSESARGQTAQKQQTNRDFEVGG
jgi:hypothetical protein